jgi:hypothetical protein
LPELPTARASVEVMCRPLIFVISKVEVLCTQVLPSVEVASFPEAPAATYVSAVASAALTADEPNEVAGKA